MAVRELEPAMEELAACLRVEWAGPWDQDIRGWPIRYTLTRGGEPHLELLQGPPGSPWDARDGSRLDHVAYSAPDVAAESERLTAAGLGLEVDGLARGATFTYHRGARSGVRVETLPQRTPAEGPGNPLHHVGVFVPELEPAMAELKALGLGWREPVEVDALGETLRVVFSRQGRPYFELLEGAFASVDQPRLDHIAYLAPDEAAERKRLVGLGLTLELADEQLGRRRVSYLHAPASGLRVELIDPAALRAA
jgi:hypothetical protein